MIEIHDQYHPINMISESLEKFPSVSLRDRALYLAVALDSYDIVHDTIRMIEEGRYGVFGSKKKALEHVASARKQARQALWDAAGYRELLVAGVKPHDTSDLFVAENCLFRTKFEKDRSARERLKDSFANGRITMMSPTYLNISPEETEKLEKIVDKTNVSYDDAKRHLGLPRNNQ